MPWDTSQFGDRAGLAAGDFRFELADVTTDGIWERVAIERAAAVDSRLLRLRQQSRRTDDKALAQAGRSGSVDGA